MKQTNRQAHKQKMITTNLRLPEPDWLQTKALAAEMGLSLNQYALNCITNANKNRAMAQTNQADDVIWQLPNIAKSIKSRPQHLTTEDEDIYGL